MRIGIDIDDTLTNTSEVFDRILKENDVVFAKGYNDFWTDGEAEYILSNYHKQMINEVKLKDGAKEAIDYLNSLGHKIFIITARNNHYFDKTEDITIKFLNDNGIEFEGIYFNQSKKSDLAKKLKLDLMIDDNINVYNSMIENNIDCILFGNKIKTWKEVLEYIKVKEESNG